MCEKVKVSYAGNRLKTESTPMYYITTAPVSQPVDTGLTNTDMLMYSELAFTIIIVSSGGVRYPITSRISTHDTGNPKFLDLKFTESIELLDQIGDITLSIWLDSVTGTVQYQYDVDGSGITFESAIMLGYNYYI